MKYLSEFASWETFAAVQAQVAHAEAERAERQMEIIKATKMMQSMKKVTQARNDALTSPEYTQAQTNLEYHTALRRGHEIQRDAMERYGKVVSRELTRRTSIEPVQSRNNKWNA